METTTSEIPAGAALDLDVLQQDLAAQGVRYLMGAWVDIHGVPKSKVVPIDHLSDMAGGSERYTPGPLDGMGDLGPHEDDCEAIPDLDAMVVLPWDTRYALAPAHLRYLGAPYSHDSRQVLKNQVAAAAELGFMVNVGVEPELYVLRDGPNGIEPLVTDDALNVATRGYDLETTMQADAYLEPMVDFINALGWDVYSFDHEGGDGQYEFDFAYTDALAMADRMVVFRLMAKHVARSLGAMASFMPKPYSDSFGSGAHINVSFADLATGENAFVTRGEDGTVVGYTDTALAFTAGLLRHAGAITALACSTVNSYKRLVPVGLMNEISWAPVHAAYGNNNRTLMCRLPSGRGCVELRTADSACNFYLVIGLMIAAGLEGVRLGLDPGAPVDEDTYTMTEVELASAGAGRLPQTLGQAVDALEADDLAREVLGPDFHATFVQTKRDEWRTFNLVVGEWEREQYLRRW